MRSSGEERAGSRGHSSVHLRRLAPCASSSSTGSSPVCGGARRRGQSRCAAGARSRDRREGEPRTGNKDAGTGASSGPSSLVRARVMELGDGSGIAVPEAVVKMNAWGVGVAVVLIVCCARVV